MCLHLELCMDFVPVDNALAARLCVPWHHVGTVPRGCLAILAPAPNRGAALPFVVHLLDLRPE